MASQSNFQAALSATPPVLVVDDNDDIREAIREFLEVEGFLVATASNGQEAMERLDSGLHPGLILLDLMMPEMSGWEVLDKLKKSSSLAEIPVAVMSGSHRGDVPRSAYFVTKPFQLDRIVELAQAHCHPVAA